jgi:hypothetical protein
MKVSSKTRTIAIVAAVLVAAVAFNWLSDEFLRPEIKASFTISDGAITIENLNRVAWKDPWFSLDDSAELRVSGLWEPHTKRTFQLTDFKRRESDRGPHDRDAKKGFTIMISSSGCRTTVFYDWNRR